MLQIVIPEREYFDQMKQEFVYLKEQKLTLEHSLISISKWESKWKKPFLDKADKTPEESADYIRCMIVGKEVDPRVLQFIPQETYRQINEYIADTMTATWFNEGKRRPGMNQVVTSELIYYWMIAFHVPPEYEKWHLNRLLTLIKVCELKNGPQKKMKRKEIYSRNAALNAARKKRIAENGGLP